MSKRTYQPKAIKRVKKHGFLLRQVEKFKILSDRRNKKRTILAKTNNKRYK